MKILLVDDHALFREGMRYVLQQLPEAVDILEAGNFPDGLKLAEQNPELDLALLDLNMPGSEGPISIRFFHQHYPHIPVVVVSGEEGRGYMKKVMDYGAMGFVCKSSTAPVMLSALNLVLSGGVYIPPQILQQHGMTADSEPEPADRRSLNTNEYGLTQRQMEVLTHLAAGLSNKEIAGAIRLAEGTVKIHVAAIYQILRVGSRMEAVRVAGKLGLFGGAGS
ncbi:MAG: response regulator transcription factor [Hydrogenophilales bacterium]|nr:response regulator transcription factor [Hydrogenophilales bacterium]